MKSDLRTSVDESIRQSELQNIQPCDNSEIAAKTGDLKSQYTTHIERDRTDLHVPEEEWIAIGNV